MPSSLSPDSVPATPSGLTSHGDRDAPRGRWPWIHAVLFLFTILTTVFAPHVWDVRWDRVEGVSDVLRPDFVYAFWVLLILGSHEMGHYFACRYYGVPATLPFFIPGIPPIGTFGAVIRIRGMIPNRRALFDIAAAGPLAGFAIALPVFVIGLLQGKPTDLPGGDQALGPPVLSIVLMTWLHPEAAELEVGSAFLAGWVGMLVTSLNLFPVGQLDGGHVMYAISRRAHRIAARATLVVMLLVVMAQTWLFLVPAYLLWFLILLWMRARHPRLLEETTPLGGARVVIAFALLLIFLASFIPVPIVFG